MSKKSKIILIIAIIFVSLISVAAIVMFFISQVTVTHVSSAILTPVEDNISDYSLYEADDEESHEVTVHNDPEAFQYDLSAIELPEDFSFKIAWGYGYSSYYNSKTGKMIRDRNEREIEKYTKYVLLSEYELKLMYKYLFVDTDITKYSENYNPKEDGQSDIIHHLILPYRSLKITVYANGEEKTVAIEYYSSIGDRSAPFIKSVDSIVGFITSTPEWKAFPETTVGYM